MNIKSKEYCGCSNHETYLAGLWVNNDYELYHYWLSIAEEKLISQAGGNDSAEKYEAARSCLALSLREEIRGRKNPLANQSSLYADLLSCSLSLIDWQDVAETILSQVAGRD